MWNVPWYIDLIKPGEGMIRMDKRQYRFKTKNGTEYVVNDEPVNKLFTAQDIYNARMTDVTGCASFFGYQAEEILKIIEKHERENRKMTREDAYKKLANSQAGKKIKIGDIPFSMFCDYLEALGLIKFEEEETPFTMHLVPRGSTSTVEIYTDSMIKMLRSIGYKVDKCK